MGKVRRNGAISIEFPRHQAKMGKLILAQMPPSEKRKMVHTNVARENAVSLKILTTGGGITFRRIDCKITLPRWSRAVRLASAGNNGAFYAWHGHVKGARLPEFHAVDIRRLRTAQAHASVTRKHARRRSKPLPHGRVRSKSSSSVSVSVTSRGKSPRLLATSAIDISGASITPPHRRPPKKFKILMFVI